MGKPASGKWFAACELHEVWGAPLELLAGALGVSSGFVQRRAIAEQWAAHLSTSGVHARLIKLFEKQLVRFADVEQELDEEKRARALSVLAKTLESIAAVGTKLSANSGNNSDQKSGRRNETVSGMDEVRNPDQTEDLDRKLTELADNLVQSRALERVSEASAR